MKEKIDKKEHGENLGRDRETFVGRLAQKLGITANAKYIFAAPIESDGVMVVPVAKAIYGFGGGSGEKENEQGSGGGGGVVLTPVGYIEIKNGETRFRPTRDWLTILPMIATTAPIILFSLWGLRRLLNRKSEK